MGIWSPRPVCHQVGAAQIGTKSGVAQTDLEPKVDFGAIGTNGWPNTHLKGGTTKVVHKSGQFGAQMAHLVASCNPIWTKVPHGRQNTALGPKSPKDAANAANHANGFGTYQKMRQITLMQFCIQLCTNSCHIVS